MYSRGSVATRGVVALLVISGVVVGNATGAGVTKRGDAAGVEAPGLADVFGGYASTHVLARCRAGVSLATDPVLQATLQKWRVTKVRPVFEGGFGDPQRAAGLGLDRWYRVEVPGGTDTPALAAALRAVANRIEIVELDPVGMTANALPDDPDFPLQYGLLNTGQVVIGERGISGADINVVPTWDTLAGDPEVVLAVLDTGIDPHPDLQGRIIAGRNVAASPDDDDLSDVCIFHGTHVAGISAANTNNALGISGVDRHSRIMPIKVLQSCNGTESVLAEGIVWGTDHGADVMNMSLQYFDGTTVAHDAVRYAYEAGVTLVAASGNLAGFQVAFPARWPETIAVGAIDNKGARWIASNRGPMLDIVAPGVFIWSLDGGGAYKYLSGTSMATAFTSGFVGLLLARDRMLSPPDVVALIESNAVDLETPGFDINTGHGRLDATATIEAVPPVAGDLNGDGAVNIADLLLLLSAWGPCDECPGVCTADLDGSCSVDVVDLLSLLALWR